MNDFKTYLTQTKEAIQQEMDVALAAIKTMRPKLMEECEQFVASMQGGKNIRGTLVLLGYDMAGGKKTHEIYKIAAAYEILHASLLIHDDIIDKSPVRRGQPTVYKALGQNHYSISQAICLGDMGLFLANQLIAESSFDNAIKVRVLATFSEIVRSTIWGEMLDVKLSLLHQEKNEGDVLFIYKLKTAYYTIVGPLTISALLGGASTQQLDVIQRFGEAIGLAFQMQDDILGVFGDEKETGKSATSDIEENKNTLLIAHALHKATPAQKKILLTYYGKKHITARQHQVIKTLFEKTGALDYANQKIQEYMLTGEKLIPSLTDKKDIQGLLKQFIQLLINRKK